MNYVYLKIPRFDGRKTLAFNGLVILAASAAHIWLVTGGEGTGLDDRTWLVLLCAVAALNGLLRLVTERPVWWRQWWHVGVDPAAEGADETVYRRAAEFVKTSDFTDIRESEQSKDRLHRPYRPPELVPYADFQRDLDKRLVDTREAFDGVFYGNGPHVLPLDADERVN